YGAHPARVPPARAGTPAAGGAAHRRRSVRQDLPARCGRAGAVPSPPLALRAVRRGRGAGPRAAATARDSVPRADRPVPLLVDHRNRGRESREPRRLRHAIPLPMARRRLAALARAARRHAAAPGRADPAVGGPRRPGPLSGEGNSLSPRLGRDAGGAAGVATLVAPFTPPRSGSGAHPPAGAAREPLTT